MHTLFNIVTTCILLPFGEYLASLAEVILPEPKNTGKMERPRLSLEDFNAGNKKLGYSAIHLEQLKEEIEYMLGIAKEKRRQNG